MKWCRTAKADIAPSLGYWLKNITVSSFILFFLKLMLCCFHLPFPPATLFSSHLTVHALQKTRTALIHVNCFSQTKSMGLCKFSFLFLIPARSIREDTHIPLPHISAHVDIFIYSCVTLDYYFWICGLTLTLFFVLVYGLTFPVSLTVHGINE